MSKSDRARKRATERAVKVAPVGLPGLAPVPRKQGNGRTYRSPAARDPQAEMLKARCRRWGKPTSHWREMRDPWWGCEAGGAMALAVANLAERKLLWDAINWTRSTMTAFDAAMGAPRRHAQCLKLLLPVEEMSADSTTPQPDDRTDEERQDDAVARYQLLGELSGRAGPAAQDEALRVIVDDAKPRDVAAMVVVLSHISVWLQGKR